MCLIDTHCHLDDPAFAPDLGAVLDRVRAAGVDGVITVGVSPDRWPDQIEAAREAVSHGVGAGLALGIHPWWAEEVSLDSGLEQLGHWLDDPAAVGMPPDALVAIGEVGLDFAAQMPDTDRQCRLFDAQLDLARTHDLPLILHARKSEDRLLWYLRRRPEARGVVHGFTGSLQQAESFIEQGFLIGVGGAITHPGAHRMHRLIRALPLDAMLIETDAPNQPGHAHRGERNEPAWLGENLQALAALRGDDIDTLSAQLCANATGLFGTAWCSLSPATWGLET